MMNKITRSQVQEWELSKITPYERNAKLHPDSHIEQIADSIEEFTFLDPVAVDENGELLEGHGRFLAAKKRGDTTIPVIQIKGLSEAQKVAYRIAHNKLTMNTGYDPELLKLDFEFLQEENFDLDLTGFGEFELSFLEENIEEESHQNQLSEDDYEVPENIESRVKSGDIWQLGNHYLMCGDCTVQTNIKKLVDISGIDGIDMMFTDPPYGVNYADKNKFLNTLDNSNRNETPIENDNLDLSDCKKLWTKTFTLWGDYFNEYSSYYVASPQMFHLFHEMLNSLITSTWQIKHLIIWNKNNHVLGRCDYNYKHEPIIYGWKHKHKFYGNGEFKTSVWDIPKPQKSEEHPTMKPVSLVANCVLNSTEKDMIIADPFLGSGTTLIACEQLNRKCIGTEISEKYCEIIIQRWEKLTGAKAKLVGSLFEDELIDTNLDSLGF